MPINWTHSDIRSTLDNEAMGETVKANGATLLIQVHLFFRKEMGDSAAGTKTRTHRKPELITLFCDRTALYIIPYEVIFSVVK